MVTQSPRVTDSSISVRTFIIPTSNEEREWRTRALSRLFCLRNVKEVFPPNFHGVGKYGEYMDIQ